MTTELKRFSEAYATLTIAVYEPIIAKWYSQAGISALAESFIVRASGAGRKKAKAGISRHAMAHVGTDGGGGNGHNGGADTAMGAMASGASGAALAMVSREPSIAAALANSPEGYVNASTPGVDSELFALFPNLEVTNETAFPSGRMRTIERNGASRFAAPVPTIFGVESSTYDNGAFDILGSRKKLVDGFNSQLEKKLKGLTGPLPAKELRALVLGEAQKHLGKFDDRFNEVEFMPPNGEWLEMLSPIGIAHFYRQLFFYVNEGVGPIEQAFTISPGETLEVIAETVRRQSHEETFEHGSEVVSEQAVESRNVDEVSDKVASMVERDTTAAMSANTTFQASGGVGVWNFGASAQIGGSTSIAQSSQMSRENARRRLKEITKRASERITKTFSMRVTDSSELTTTDYTRRKIENAKDVPVSYGLRRVFNRVKVKVQDIGPSMVWQLYISKPGAGLARSRFVHFSDHEPIASPGDPPAMPPRPQGGVDTGTTSTTLLADSTKAFSDPMRFYVKLAINVPPDREITAVSIDSITDLEHLAKEDLAPSPHNGAQRNGTMDRTAGTYTVEIGVLPGDAESIQINYQYTWQPSKAVLDQWQADVDAAHAKFAQQELEAREKALRDQFERERALITEKSKVRPRAAAALRKEERYEVMNRMVSHLFRPRGNGLSGDPSPLEIELFHRYMDVDGIFIYSHPSWWKPRYSARGTGFGRPEYEITAESEPAPVGRSLGWAIQLDGDDRRNEFLNSPWVRVCVPIKAGREREAIAWLAKHIEGELGYEPTKEPLKSLLTSIEQMRANQQKVAMTGPDYVSSSTVVVEATAGAPAGPLQPENVYPVIDEFEVTVPTEGFVYDDLQVKIP